MPAPSAEIQHPEAWPASTYGHLRGDPDDKKLLSGTLPDNNLFHKLKTNKKIQSEKILDPLLKQLNLVLSIIIIFPMHLDIVSPECVCKTKYCDSLDDGTYF